MSASGQIVADSSILSIRLSQSRIGTVRVEGVLSGARREDTCKLQLRWTRSPAIIAKRTIKIERNPSLSNTTDTSRNSQTRVG